MRNNRNFAATQTLMGALLFICALVFYYFSVLTIDYRDTNLLDLGPSDPTHYFAQAKALLGHGLPSVQIGYDKMPSLWPAGYPALMLPWLKILPETDSILAPFRTNQTIGLLLLVGVFGFYLYLAMPLTGGFAALLLATLPGFFTFCRSPLSDISASAFAVLAFMFAYLGLKEERRWKIYLSGVFLGLSVNIRLQSIFFVPLLFAMALFPVKGARVRWLLHCLALPIVFVLAVSPLLVLNTIQFHSPLKTGYDYYLSPALAKVAMFSWRYIPDNAALLWQELALRPQKFTAMNQFGTGTCFVAAFILLACVGVFFIRLNRFVFCAFFSRLEFPCADHQSVPRHVLGVLSAAPNAVSRTCHSTRDVGSRKSRFAKTNYRFSGNLCFVCSGCPGLSFALGGFPTESGSIAELGSSPL